MNYIAEINAFEQWLEHNYLPISSQLLWYKLMALFNRSGWSEWVQVDNLRLMAAMQIRREATFISVRDELIKAGLIEFQKGKKGSPNKYKMISFTFKSEVKNEVQSEAQTAVQSEVKEVVQSEAQTADIYKHKPNKTNSKKDTNVSKEKVKHKRGEFGHVLLSDAEIEKLKHDFGDLTEQAVKYLDEYIEMKGYKHKNSNLVIRKWVIDAVKRENKGGNKPKNGFNNFPQRDYSGNEMSDIEKKLLEKTYSAAENRHGGVTSD